MAYICSVAAIFICLVTFAKNMKWCLQSMVTVLLGTCLMLVSSCIVYTYVVYMDTSLIYVLRRYAVYGTCELCWAYLFLATHNGSLYKSH